jgi:hypothetical protein
MEASVVGALVAACAVPSDQSNSFDEDRAALTEERTPSGDVSTATDAMDELIRRRAREHDPRADVDLSGLSDGELRQWFAAQRLLTRGDESPLDQLDARALEDAFLREGHLPTPEQHDGLAHLLQQSLGPVEGLAWDSYRESLLNVEGALFVQRDADPAALVHGFLSAHRDTLYQALGADTNDRLELEDVARLPHEPFDEITFSRYRGDARVDANTVTFRVTHREHRYGAGILWRIAVRWDRAAAEIPPHWGTADSETLAGARAAVGADQVVETTPIIMCRPEDGVRVCRLVDLTLWEVESDGSHARPNVTLSDVRDGSLLEAIDTTAHWSGEVNFTNVSFAYENYSTASPRDMPRAVLRHSGGATYTLSSAATYNWTPASPWATTGLRGIFQHLNGSSCGSTPDPLERTVALDNGMSWVGYFPDSSGTHTAASAFAWLNWFEDTRAGLGTFFESGTTVRYDMAITTGLGASAAVCSLASDISVIRVSSTDDSGSSDLLWSRFLFGHEWAHTAQWATRDPGTGSGLLPSTNPSPYSWNEALPEAVADAYGAWAFEYENGGSEANLSEWRYFGPDQPGDVMLDDEEIDGTSTFNGANPCRHPSTNAWLCNDATEACWSRAHIRPRCMRRAVTLADCWAMPVFAGQPQAALVSGTLSTGAAVTACGHDGYANGGGIQNILHHLWATEGYLGVGTVFAMHEDITSTTAFTLGADNYHDYMVSRGSGDFEVSSAFHAYSTESSFTRWADDTTDSFRRAQFSRPARGTSLSYSVSGPGTLLRFDSATDVDAFLVPTDYFSTWRFSATTTSTSVDLCVRVYRLDTGAQVASAGCTDGSSTPALRNASVDVSTSSIDRYAMTVSNVLGISNVAYSIGITNVGDDYPDSLSAAMMAEPLRPNVAVAASLNDTSDYDLFRYDRRGETGPLSFTVTGIANPTIRIYFVANEAIPTAGDLVVSSTTGTATVSSPALGRYYAFVSKSGSTGSYSIIANACSGGCVSGGTYDAPRSLPTAAGGFVRDSIESASWVYPWEDMGPCVSGVGCDWFSIDMAANERISVSTYGESSSLCQLEIGIVPPDEQDYFTSDDPNVGGRFPAVRNAAGSMESYGASLNFIARRGGEHRVRVRPRTGSTCANYYLGVVRTGFDTLFVPPVVN